MSRVSPIDPKKVYPRDASWWVNPSQRSAFAYHRPSEANYGFAACSSRILLATELGYPSVDAAAMGILCQRSACQKER